MSEKLRLPEHIRLKFAEFGRKGGRSKSAKKLAALQKNRAAAVAAKKRKSNGN